MKIVSKIFLSMTATLVMLFIFAVAIAAATFIENDFGTEAAKALVYNATWFEALLLLLSINLVANIIKFKMWRKDKLLSFVFHASFLIILLGAAVTRYVGYEGSMHIREGATSNTITSEHAYLQIHATDGTKEAYKARPLILSTINFRPFTEKLKVGDADVRVRVKEFILNAGQRIVPVEDGVPVLSLVVSHRGTRQNVMLSDGDVQNVFGILVGFNADSVQGSHVIQIRSDGEKLFFKTSKPTTQISMSSQSSSELEANQEYEMLPMTLYSMGTFNFVVRNYYPSGSIKAGTVVAEDGKDSDTGYNALVADVTARGVTREVSLFGGRGIGGEPKYLKIGDLNVSLAYGSTEIPLPFALKLIDFQIERYPGSNSPSSYASEVILIDQEQGLEQPYRIYMNHILKHRGFRFFQSSYDRDEQGTILSVSFDPGTPITYVGYLLLAIGFFGILINPKSHYRKLGNKLKTVRAKRASLAATVLLLMSFLTLSGARADEAEQNQAVNAVKSFDYKHSREFGKMLVQDHQGRIKPIDTMAHEVLNKVARKDRLLGLHPDQIALGMFIQPEHWQKIKMIKVRDPLLKKILGMGPRQKYVSFLDFFDPHTNQYILTQYVDKANRKRPAMHDKLDKAVLKVDEKVNICYLMYTGALFEIFPKKGDPNHTWYNFRDAMHQLPEQDSQQINDLMKNYIDAVDSAVVSGDWTAADVALGALKKFQFDNGAAVIPSAKKIKAEIMFNDLQIFERLWPIYLLSGFILLLLGFIQVLRPRLKLGPTTIAFSVIFFFGFLAHSFGLALRWYVSGHAPWSNGYESMIYIAWATVLAGFFFAKREPMPLAATGILAGLILFVAHLSWMDPQITNLVPVLKSYWLTIHVSMITASYGFLGLGALLAFIVLFLFIFKRRSNAESVELAIEELTYINERALTIGLIMLTIGNFLGAIWANESWGRYWGWDPKETWALVTILVYSIIIHFRLIPKLRGYYLFNVTALLAFGSVIMTYFGVNYYLSGLHSYAQGDPVPVPSFVYYSVAIMFVIIALAFPKRKMIAVSENADT